MVVSRTAPVLVPGLYASGQRERVSQQGRDTLTLRHHDGFELGLATLLRTGEPKDLGTLQERSTEVPMPEGSVFPSPSEGSFNWTVKNFSKLYDPYELLYSEPFEVGGVLWCVRCR